MFEKICIIGFGLIGSSVARKMRIVHPNTKIICLDRDEHTLEIVKSLNLADYVSTDASVVQGCDMVVLATPVGAMHAVVQDIIPHLKQGCVLTDVGSVKEAIVKEIDSLLPDTVSFVAGHPIAGTEFSGPEAGFAELFENRLWLLTPTDSTPALSLQSVRAFCESLGAFVKIMPPDTHDRTLAMTSHLPQLISYMMIHTADKLGQDLRHDVIACSANGFHGFARIAASDPTMWRDVYLTNKDYVLEAIDRFEATLSDLRQAIENKDGQAMFDFFSASRARHLQHLESKKAL